jgi:hypothetical protein
MIRLERLTAEVPASLLGSKKQALELSLLEAHRNGKDSFKSSVWTPAKKTLKKESFGKCAYCESPTAHVAHADVEHFRPKSIYWWLAYWYGNYSYSCQICNQSHKRDSFPIGGRALVGPAVSSTSPDSTLAKLAGRINPDPANPNDPAWQSWRLAASKEKAGLPDPYDLGSDPEDLFSYRADIALQEVRLMARSSSAKSQRAIRAVEDHLGLNREELLRLRYERYEILSVIATSLPALTEPLRSQATKVLQKAVAPGAEWAGMARYFLFDDWKIFNR